MSTYIPSLLNLPPTPLGHHSTRLSPLCCIAGSHWLPVLHMVYIYVYTTLSTCSTLSFLCCVHKSVLYVCASIPALQIHSLVPFF